LEALVGELFGDPWKKCQFLEEEEKEREGGEGGEGRTERRGMHPARGCGFECGFWCFFLLYCSSYDKTIT